MSLKKLFKRKEGGTTFGNVLRGAAKIGSSFVPGLSALPIGEGLMMKQPEMYLNGSASLNATNEPALSSTAKSATLDEINKILKGAVNGAKTGAADVYLNDTESGRANRDEVAKDQLNKYLPYILGGAVLYLLFKKK